MAGMWSNVHFALMFISWPMIAIAFIFFRKPGVALPRPFWEPWRINDYVTPVGAVLWVVGVIGFAVLWFLAFVFGVGL
jgi:hypothetical protein